jgi:PPM family protein phosphatase
MQFVAGHAQHIGARGEQQDAFGFSNWTEEHFLAHAGFAAVLADGMGGMADGRIASTTGVRVFFESYRLKTEYESIGQALLRALRDANAAVYAHSQRMGTPGQVGSTFIACVLHAAHLYWVSVGDSVLYLFRENALYVLNTSHTYGQYLDQAAAEGKITVEQALQDGQREALTSYLGIGDLTHIDLAERPLPLQPGDRVLLASDGLFKTLTGMEIAGVMSREEPLTASHRLVLLTMAKGRMYQDNVTVLCIAAGGDPEYPSARQAPAEADIADTLLYPVQPAHPEGLAFDPAPPARKRL